MVISFPKYVFNSRTQLDNAVGDWISNEGSATETYSDINNWDVRETRYFSNLLQNKGGFNSDISNWGVSSSRNFQCMNAEAKNFNHNIRSWDVSSSIIFSAMFSGATAMLENLLFPCTTSISFFDSILPNAPSSLTSSTTTNNNTPTITVSAEAGSTVRLYNGSTLTGTAAANSNGSFSKVSSALSDGCYSLTSTATDSAGNISTSSSALEITWQQNQ